MIQPHELKLNVQVVISNGAMVSTAQVWQVLVAAKKGEIHKIQQLEEACPELLYAQYNYMPPIHLAVREGHIVLVEYLLSKGAHDPDYKTYPFQDSLENIASDRGFTEITHLLNEYEADTAKHRFKGDNGKLLFTRSDEEVEFEKVVEQGDVKQAQDMLRSHPEFAKDNTLFWGEGVLLFAAKQNNIEMVDLLLSYGATVPKVLKWTQFYYFENIHAASYLLKKGMHPDTMSWQQVTILDDMAQKGFIEKAELLLQHGANINSIDEEYQSTPLGMACRWGHIEMVEFLIRRGADLNLAGAGWAKPMAWAKNKGHENIVQILLNAGAGA